MRHWSRVATFRGCQFSLSCSVQQSVLGSPTWCAACREEKQAQKQVREAAKRGDVASARLLAKELVRTRKATTQLYTNKAHMIAMGTQLQEQLAMVKVRGCFLRCCNISIPWGCL